MAALKERDTASAEKAGVSPEAIIRLAQRINADIHDFNQALLELERAVSVAVEVAAEGRRSSNVGDFVNLVLARIAEKSANGQFDEAAKEADTAFAQWQRDEAERRDAAGRRPENTGSRSEAGHPAARSGIRRGAHRADGHAGISR